MRVAISLERNVEYAVHAKAALDNFGGDVDLAGALATALLDRFQQPGRTPRAGVARLAFSADGEMPLLAWLD